MSIYQKYVDFINETQLMLPADQWYFKSDINYTYMLEHVNPKQGNEYLDIIKKKFSDFYKKNYEILIELCHLNDKYGKTKKNKFKDFTKCSPSNLRYILHSLLILEHMKKNKLNHVNVIEIGGGYGGLCLFIHKISKLYEIEINSYAIFDLLEASNLQRKYLESLEIKNVDFYQLDKYNNLNENSFLISTYAFSEIPMSIQKIYSKKIINPFTNYGFIAWNNIPVYDFVKDCVIKKEVEYPITKSNNYFVRYQPV